MVVWNKGSFVKLLIAIILLPFACNLYLQGIHSFLGPFAPPTEGGDHQDPQPPPQAQQQRAGETEVKPAREEEETEKSAGTILQQAEQSPSHVSKVPAEPELSLFQSDRGLSNVSIWLDLPNAFPWRHCLQEYNNLLTPLACDPTLSTQLFTLQPLNQSKQFRWKTPQGDCVVPGRVVHEKEEKDVLRLDRGCGKPGHWTWSRSGQVRWSQGCQKCVQSIKINKPLELAFCRDNAEDQSLELGRWVETGGRSKLTPLNIPAWRARQDNMREAFLAAERPGMRRAVKEVEMDDLLHQYDKVEEGRRRRAAVFYLDKGSSGLAMVRWWLTAWRLIGLDSAEEGFDLVFMTHPANVANLPSECQLVTERFSVNYTAPGQCLYRPYLGIAHRDKSYDPYMNSQECLYGPGSEFLSQYTLLLRADLDTFPTPRFLGYWPKGIIVDKDYHTNFDMKTIKNAIRRLACSAGIEHQGWFNPGSTWYGEARRVRNMAKITVALNKYGKALLFGPGTDCRCSDCNLMPDTCQWGGGPYAGTMLLYLQEVAVNKILTQAEWDSLPRGLLDQGVADQTRSVCEPALLHCMHNPDRFSKLAFGVGKYIDLDMGELDLTKVRDYATYIALTANSQGKGGEAALGKLKEKLGKKTWSEYCTEGWWGKIWSKLNSIGN